ncbi:hypothetical protein RKD29_007752 [Streptomyces tendae]|uniref:hypothetical protein n=1 Tax=Streptomyces tendae TaxID=1932 RepID=UPI00383241E6
MDLTFECEINGRSLGAEQIALLSHQREIHVLHELKRAGARLERDGAPLSDDAINALAPEAAQALSIAVRRSYSFEDYEDMFREQLAASDQMWRGLRDASGDRPLQPCVADLTFHGVSYDDFARNVHSMAPFLDGYAQCNPDHFSIKRDGDELRLIEIFGMCGGPSALRLSNDPGVVVPIEHDESYPVEFAGRGALRDGMDAGNPAYHQVKPIDGGVAVRAGCALPAAAPQAMVEGHKMHLAIEFIGFARYVAGYRA